MTREQLVSQIKTKQSYLCVGLDTDVSKLPSCLLQEEEPVLSFNKAIIDATREYCVSYKINTAFYEAMGAKGWSLMEKTIQYIGKHHFIIADAKRGDIGNTSTQYARAFFETLPCDAVTVAPYMGEDSVKPFLQFDGKWAIVLGLTSNPGAQDFELEPSGNELLYQKVIRTVAGWGSSSNLMFVVGATQSSSFATIRKLVPHHFLLVPGVGAQGGSLQDISSVAMNKDGGLLVNVSRAILYVTDGLDFATKAGEVAKEYQQEMASYLKKAGVI
jgi:orotidine-5'-phosphate decarboxylase